MRTWLSTLTIFVTANSFAAVRKQSKTNWRPELTAPVINDWLRAGFGAKKAAQ
jgi:hypothetical protein